MSMQSHWRVNVSKKDPSDSYGTRFNHVFATASHSLVSKDKAWHTLDLIRQKFPETEGYKVDMVYWECRGHPC